MKCIKLNTNEKNLISLFKESTRHNHGTPCLIDRRRYFECLKWKYVSKKLIIEYLGPYKSIEVNGVFKIKESTPDTTVVTYRVRYPVPLIIAFYGFILVCFYLIFRIITDNIENITSIDYLFSYYFAPEMTMIMIPIILFIVFFVYSKSMLSRARVKIENSFKEYFSEYI